jgi:hypothetical protein
MITERAMLAAVHISIWTAVKHDRKVSRQVADEHGAPESAGRYNKKLLGGAARLDDLRSLAGQIRQSFYKIPFRGRMKVTGCCPHTSISTGLGRCESLRRSSSAKSKTSLRFTRATSNRFGPS